MKKELTFDKLPPKNYLIQFLLFFKFLLFIPIIKRIIKLNLKNCSNIDFIPGFRYLYGNIYAKNNFLCDTFFIDNAPIYIGENTQFSHGNMVITAWHDILDFHTVKAKSIHIGKDVWITSRCVILPGVRIGDGSIIGAGSVVTKDIPANCLAVGNPAKPVRYFKNKRRNYTH